jgi:hypothetical protein
MILGAMAVFLFVCLFSAAWRLSDLWLFTILYAHTLRYNLCLALSPRQITNSVAKSQKMKIHVTTTIIHAYIHIDML